MTGNFLFQAVIYLTAAIICVPIAKRLGMGSVLGYLLAGIAIGPFFLGFVGEEGESIMHFAEFGVVMMLFLIGLELEPDKLWRMRRMLLGLGSFQVGATVLLVFVACLLSGFHWQSALAIGLALSLSSTAIGLQSLNEKGLMKTAAGTSSFSVLLFQDMAVIPMLAFLPLLTARSIEGGSTHVHSPIASLPAAIQTLVVLGSVGVIVVAGRYVFVPILRQVAKTRLRELFTASALLIVLAIAYLMELVGLSPALGTFLGGVVLANSEFKHALESDLDPFKGLLLGLFFLAVGASINFGLVAEDPAQLLVLVVGIVLLKWLVLVVTGRIFRLRLDQNLIFSLTLAQVGEFSFVLLTFMSQLEILDPDLNQILMAVTALSMTFTPILLLFNEKVLQPRIGTLESVKQEMDTIEEEKPVILVGFAHFGSTVGRFLRANGVEATILDHDSDRVDLLRRMGFRVYYGDATRHDLLESAGADQAKLLISAIDSPETNYQLVKMVKKHFPNLEIMMRTRNRYDAYEMIDLGVKNIYRESLDTSVRMGVDVLRKLGFRAYTTRRLAQDFIRYDEEAMWQLVSERHDKSNYVSKVREMIENQEALLKEDQKFHPGQEDHAWDSEHMRTSLNKT